MTVHAHLVIAESIASSGLDERLKKESADTSHLVRSQLGIEDARELTRQSAQRGFAGERRFIVSAESITPEAQNALLKLFEDPPAGAVFYLLVPDESGLLPTLRSRLIETAPRGEFAVSADTERFLRSSYGERMEWIADRAKKDPEALSRLVADIGRLSLEDEDAKRALLLVSRFIKNRGASRKMLAEELALSVAIEK